MKASGTYIPFPVILRQAALSAALLLSLSAVQGLVAQAQTLAGDELSSYEMVIFSHAYTDEPLGKRLDRLESSVFGEAQTGSEMDRKNRLLKVLGSVKEAVPAASKPLEPQPENPPMPDEQAGPYTPAGNPMVEQEPVRPPDATDYPKITALEQEVFGRDFIRDPLENRLSRLEKKVFGQPAPQTQLIDRVDKLLARFPHLNTPTAALNREQYPESAISSLPSSSSQFVGSRDVYAKVEALEKRLLGGQNHSGELLTERLDRLERQLYGKTYGGESVDTRTSRLMRNFEVASNSGTQQRQPFQSRQSYQPAPQTNSTGYQELPFPNQPPPPQRQNVQVGSVIGSTHQFSREMMDMLPPEIRSQMSGSQNSSRTVVSSPGTVIVERQSVGYPGMQQYGNGAPIQYYNYYGQPTAQTQSQTTTTVIQPDGSSMVYSYPTATSQAYPNPAYVGDPSFLQALGNLEINVFGRVNTMEPVYVRLGKLETAMTGQIYQGYPETQRLANLQRTYQMQSIGRMLGTSKTGSVGRAAGSTMLGIPLTPPTQNPNPAAPPVYGGTSPLGVPTQ